MKKSSGFRVQSSVKAWTGVFLVFTVHCSLLTDACFSAFEPLGFGAPARSVAGAYTALADDAYAAHWNPAALALIKTPQAASSWEDLGGLGLVRHMGFAYVQPGVGGGGLGFAWTRLGTVKGASFLDYSENSYALSYGWRTGPLKTGVSLKYYSVDGALRASGMGVDAAAGIDLLEKKIGLAVAARDLNKPSLRWETGALDHLPAAYAAALSLQPFKSLRLALEETWRGDEQPILHAGLAYEPFNRKLSLRSGASRSSRQDDWEIGAGAGVRVSNVQVDFAWVHNADLEDSQNVSLVVRFP